jgi:hypothetical protein
LRSRQVVLCRRNSVVRGGKDCLVNEGRVVGCH